MTKLSPANILIHMCSGTVVIKLLAHSVHPGGTGIWKRFWNPAGQSRTALPLTLPSDTAASFPSTPRRKSESGDTAPDMSAGMLPGQELEKGEGGGDGRVGREGGGNDTLIVSKNKKGWRHYSVSEVPAGTRGHVSKSIHTPATLNCEVSYVVLCLSVTARKV